MNNITIVYSTLVTGNTIKNDNTTSASRINNACDVFTSEYLLIIRAITDVPPSVLLEAMTSPEPTPINTPANTALIKFSSIPKLKDFVKSKKMELAVIVMTVYMAVVLLKYFQPITIKRH